jgi:cytochrome c
MNKILGLVLGTLLFLQAVRIIDESFVTKPASEAAAKEEQPQAGAAAAVPIDTLLASASADRGAQVASNARPVTTSRRARAPRSARISTM